MPKKLTGTLTFGIASDLVSLRFDAEDGEPAELELTSAAASQFAADLSQAVAKSRASNEQILSMREQGYDTAFAPLVAIADYGLDRQSGDIFLRLRDEQGTDFCYLIDRDEIVQFAQTLLLRLSDLPSEGIGRN